MKKLKAFSLIELIIAISIAATLAAISFSSLAGVKTGYRRKEAQSELLKLKALIQQNILNYGCSAQDVVNWLQAHTSSQPGCTTPTTSAAPYCQALNSVTAYATLPILSPNGYYCLTASTGVDSSTAITVILTATANASGPQISDSVCRTITLTSNMGATEDIQGSTGSTPNNPVCWQ